MSAVIVYINKLLAIYFLISAVMVCCMSCKPAEKPTEPEATKPFEPQGDLSDLVHNPVRPDGTIDSSFLPIMAFEETQYDFGTIYEGDVVKKEFVFKNTGTAPLLVLNATSTCGCTVPEWPDKPIPPDSTGSIKVKFDSKNKLGPQNKEVTIFANTFPNRNIIVIKGNVEKTK